MSVRLPFFKKAQKIEEIEEILSINNTNNMIREGKQNLICEVCHKEFEIKGVKGKFVRSGDLLIIKVTDKPWLASWGLIEEKMDEFFSV